MDDSCRLRAGAARVVLAAISALLLAGCIVIRDSAAPGCRRVLGFPAMGGCHGKTIITDVTVEPPIACLSISANNCNGGVLAVANDCEDVLALDGQELRPGDRASFDLVEEDGRYTLSRAAGNFSTTQPATDVQIELLGHLGGRPLTVRLTKTAPLCE